MAWYRCSGGGQAKVTLVGVHGGGFGAYSIPNLTVGKKYIFVFSDLNHHATPSISGANVIKAQYAINASAIGDKWGNCYSALIQATSTTVAISDTGPRPISILWEID